MPNPPRPDLVHKAISAGIFGNIEWKPEAINRVVDDPELREFPPKRIRNILRDFVRHGNELEVRDENREQWLRENPDHPYWYMAIIPVDGIPKGLFVEVTLLDDQEEDEPFVQIVNAHPEK